MGIKDTDGQSDEEIHRMKSGKVLSAEASVPVELGWVTSCGGGDHQPESSLKLHHWDFETSSYAQEQSLTPFPAPALSLEDEGMGLKIPTL